MKKLTAAVLALVLALAMTACGNMEKTKTIYVHTQSVRTIGEQEIRSEYTYSPKGTPVTVKTYFNDKLYQTASTRTSGGVNYLTVKDREGNESTQTTNTIYDDNGNVASVEISVAATTVSRTRYTYDDQNRVLTANTVTSQGNTDTSYTYDANGNVTEQIVDDATDGSYTRTVYTYNDRNYVQEEKSYDRDGVLQGGIVYTYQGDNTGRTATYYDAEWEPTGEVVESTYDEHGNLIREVSSMDGEVIQTIVNTYEAMEVPVEEK